MPEVVATRLADRLYTVTEEERIVLAQNGGNDAQKVKQVVLGFSDGAGRCQVYLECGIAKICRDDIVVMVFSPNQIIPVFRCSRDLL